MANIFVTNQFPSSSAGVLAMLADMLMTAGWTYQGSGDGLSGYSAAGNVFTGTGTGALGWNNANAWARLQDPLGVKEYVFQNVTQNGVGVRIKFSKTAKFTGGSPSATTAPTATDQIHVAGNSGSASSRWVSYGLNSNGAARNAVVFHGMAQDTAPYGFWVIGVDYGTNIPKTAFIVDPVRGVGADPDPYVYLFSGPGVNATTYALTQYTSANFWNPDVEGSTFMSSTTGVTASANEMPLGVMSSLAVLYPLAASGYHNGAVGTSWKLQQGMTGNMNPFDGKYDSYPVVYTRPIGPQMGSATAASVSIPYPGVKGWSTFCHWTLTPRVPMSTANNKSLICVGPIWLPWNGSTPPGTGRA